MKVESIAECSPWSLKTNFRSFESDHFRQVLLYEIYALSNFSGVFFSSADFFQNHIFRKILSEVSSTMRALTDVRLNTLLIKIYTRTTSVCKLSHS